MVRSLRGLKPGQISTTGLGSVMGLPSSIAMARPLNPPVRIQHSVLCIRWLRWFLQCEPRGVVVW